MNPTRRDMLKLTGGSTLLALSGLNIPSFLLQASLAAGRNNGSNVLVVLQFAGGNDGINTLIPHGDDAYRAARPNLGIGAGQLRKIDDYHAFHPALAELHRLYDDSQVAVLQGVGYPNPNRSHFESMDIWHTATMNGKSAGRSTGWLGRYLDAQSVDAGADAPAIHLGGDRQPLALAADRARAATIADPSTFRLKLEGWQADEWIDTAVQAPRSEGDSLLGFMQRSSAAALASSRRVQQSLARKDSAGKYPNSALANQLRIAAQLISSGLNTRIYYLSLAGFDTHANQLQTHSGLLKQYADAVAAFMDDLKQRGQADRVMVMSFSEFGRRVHENASAGTDHGAAGPMFLVGPKVKSGLIGKHPSMSDLVQGDLKFHTDFRAVYATILQRWLGVSDAQAILGGQYPAMDLLKA